MSLSFPWPLKVLVISAVLQQGMTAMWVQTPGCPVTALYLPDDRKEKLTAKVSAAEDLVSVLAYVTVNTLCVVLWWWRTFKNQFKSLDAIEGVQVKGHKKVLWWEIPELGRTQSTVWGVWLRVSGGANGKASSPTVCVWVCVWVPAHVFSAMAVGQTAAQYGFDFAALFTAASDIVVWKHTRFGMNTCTSIQSYT